jgi:hypothetical protein
VFSSLLIYFQRCGALMAADKEVGLLFVACKCQHGAFQGT